MHQLVGVSIRHLPTAGVCDQRVGASLSHLATEGVYDQRVGESLRHLPTAGVCDQLVGTSLTDDHLGEVQSRGYPGVGHDPGVSQGMTFRQCCLNKSC